MLHENHARTLCKNKEKTNIMDSRQAKKMRRHVYFFQGKDNFFRKMRL